MIRYGKILADAWRRTWRSWAMWGWLALGYSIGVAAVVLWFVVLLGTGLGDSAPNPTVFIGLFAAVALLGLFSAVLYLLYNGALVHLSNEGLEGRPVRFGDGFRAGMRFLPRVAGLDIIVWGAVTIVGALGFAALFGIISLMDSSPDSAAGGFIAAFCCGYALMLLVLTIAVMIGVAFEAIAVRAIVISGSGVFGALASARDALRYRFKQVFVMGIIVAGLYYALQMVTSVLLTPFQFIMFANAPDPSSTADPTAFLGSMGIFYIAAIVLTYATMLPFMVFNYHVWTGFYRQLFGIEVVEPKVPVAQPVRYANAEEPAAIPGAPQAPYTGVELPPPPAPPAVAAGIPAPPAAPVAGTDVPPPPAPPAPEPEAAPPAEPEE